MKRQLETTNKDKTINSLREELGLVKQQKQKLKRSLIMLKFNNTSTCQYKNTSKFTTLNKRVLAKSYLIKCFPSSPPSLDKCTVVKVDKTKQWKGTFSTVTPVVIPTSSSETLAMKSISMENTSVVDVLAEAKVMHAVSRHHSFPYCYGIVKTGVIIMQFLGSFESGHATLVTLQSIMGQKNLSLENWVEISIQSINAAYN